MKTVKTALIVTLLGLCMAGQVTAAAEIRGRILINNEPPVLAYRYIPHHTTVTAPRPMFPERVHKHGHKHGYNPVHHDKRPGQH